MLLGGRVAEELWFLDPTTGASNDIERATQIARRMVCEYGMSEKLGPISFSAEEEHIFLGREIARTRTHSEDTARLIDSEVRRIIEEAHTRAREVIVQNRDKLEAIAQALLKYESITGEDVQMLLRGEKIDEIKDREAAEERAREERAKAEDKGSRPDTGWKPTQNPLPGPQQA
jgi:cell division protease FtsH